MDENLRKKLKECRKFIKFSNNIFSHNFVKNPRLSGLVDKHYLCEKCNTNLHILFNNSFAIYNKITDKSIKIFGQNESYEILSCSEQIIKNIIK